MTLKSNCWILGADYYFSSRAYAAFVVAACHGLPLQDAWRIVSAAPAGAEGLTDRGVIAQDRRADLILVEREAGNTTITNIGLADLQILETEVRLLLIFPRNYGP